MKRRNECFKMCFSLITFNLLILYPPVSYFNSHPPITAVNDESNGSDIAFSRNRDDLLVLALGDHLTPLVEGLALLNRG